MLKRHASLTCIVNTYNRAGFIEECIRSILSQQTSHHIEIVVVDDCSTDNTKDVIEAIQTTNPKNNLHFFSTKENTGLGKAALKELKGELAPFMNADYIYRIDSDDYIIDPMKFEKQVSTLESNPDCIATCHYFKVRNEKENTELLHDSAVVGTYSARDLIELYHIEPTYNHASTYLYRNIHQSVMPPAFENNSWAKGDVLLNWAALRYGKICYTSDVMTVYRQHDGGVWNSLSTQRKTQLNREMVFRIFLLLSPENKYRLIKQLSNIYLRKQIARWLTPTSKRPKWLRRAGKKLGLAKW